jgi:hypothetical protein
MKPQEQSEETIYEAALALPPDQQAAYLDKKGAGDAQLCQRVKALPRVHEQAGEFVAATAAGPVRSAEWGVRNADSPEPAEPVRISVLLTERDGDIASHEVSSTCRHLRRPLSGEDCCFHTNRLRPGLRGPSSGVWLLEKKSTCAE